MSRTTRHTTSRYYASDKTVPLHVRRREVEVNAKYYRCRWFHGYDGGWSSRLSDVFRADDEVRYGYGDRGHGQKGKQHLKKRANTLVRNAGKRKIADQLDDYWSG